MTAHFARTFRALVLFLVAGLTLSPFVQSAEMTYGHKGKVIKAAAIDFDGNVQLVYDDGGKQQVTTDGHCEQVSVADDQQTVGWLLNEKMGFETPSGPENRIVSKLIIFKAGRIICAIDPKVKIEAWKFWLDRTQAVIQIAPPRGPAYYALYGIPRAHEIDRIPVTTESQLLPAWALFAHPQPSGDKKEQKINTSTSSVTPSN